MSKNFMIIDDSKFIRRMTEKLLTKLGHNIIAQATNGEEAIDLFLDHWFEIDIVLLDVVMPRVDGLQVLRQILDINPYAKVIMVTSISSLAIVNRCMGAGAVEFIVKPFRLSEFVKSINNVISE